MEKKHESVIDIDEFALDREWYRQPKLVMEYGLLHAEAKRKLADRKAELDFCKADLGLKIRNDPEAYSLKKVTEATIEAAVILQDEYQTALRKYNRAKHTVDELQVVLDSLEHKKKALENAVTLHLQNYNSQPKLRNATDREVMEEETKRTARQRWRQKPK